MRAFFFFFQAEDGIRDGRVTGVQTCALPIWEPLEHEALNERRTAHEMTLIEAEQLRPGIAELLAESERLGLKRAIVSSSSRRWIDQHLRRLARVVGWDAI